MEALFLTMQEKEILEERGQLPEFIKAETGYFFDISFEFELLDYSTKWIPNIETVISIADYYQADFKHEYSEMAMGIFGEATYENGELIDTHLDFGDFNRYQWDDENGVYVFEGQTYEDDYKILKILLQQKKCASPE